MADLSITRGKGLGLEMDNGVFISIQIGGGNYCDNYGEPIGVSDSTYRLPGSSTAEIAIWGRDNVWANLNAPTAEYDNQVCGHVPISDAFGLIPILTALPDGAGKEAIELAIIDFRNKHGVH